MPPPVDHALVRRLEDAGAAFSIARLEAIHQRPEIGLGLRIERFGAAVAPASAAQPELDFVNRIERLGAAEAPRLGEILAFYASLGVDPWLELAPEPGLDELGRALGARARPVGFHTVVYASPEPSPPGRVEVRRVEPVDAEPTARLLLAGLGAPAETLATHAPALVAAVEAAAGDLYLAVVDGSPAAAAILTVTAGVGYLALAATLPDFRGRGCQTALIAARAADAAAAGCELLTSGAEFGSPSQRNLERAGFRVAYTKPVLRLTSRDERGRPGTA